MHSAGVSSDIALREGDGFKPQALLARIERRNLREPFEERFFAVRKRFWNANLDFHEEIAASLFIVKPLPREPQFLTALDGRRNGEFDVSDDRLAFDLRAQSGFPRGNFQFLNDIEAVGSAFAVGDIDAEAQIAAVGRLPFEFENRLIFCAFGDFDLEGSRLHILRNRDFFRGFVEEIGDGEIEIDDRRAVGRRSARRARSPRAGRTEPRIAETAAHI